MDDNLNANVPNNNDEDDIRSDDLFEWGSEKLMEELFDELEDEEDEVNIYNAAAQAVLKLIDAFNYQTDYEICFYNWLHVLNHVQDHIIEHLHHGTEVDENPGDLTNRQN